MNMFPKQCLPLHLFGINLNGMVLSVTVHLSVPLTLNFAKDARPAAGAVYRAAVAECQRYLTAPMDLLDSSYVDAVRPGMDPSIDLKPSDDLCRACGGMGWILSENSDHGLRIERCDDCCEFDSDREAVQYVARIAAGDLP